MQLKFILGDAQDSRMLDFSARVVKMRFHGVMVSTLDSESSDPSSNLGGTYCFADPQSTVCLSVALDFFFLSLALDLYILPRWKHGQPAKW